MENEKIRKSGKKLFLVINFLFKRFFFLFPFCFSRGLNRDVGKKIESPGNVTEVLDQDQLYYYIVNDA